jgi:serine-type D-Ala-D-Ala carboxypeptidase/endopeptidase (penicillin-binding protein 4)
VRRRLRQRTGLLVAAILVACSGRSTLAPKASGPPPPTLVPAPRPGGDSSTSTTALANAPLTAALDAVLVNTNSCLDVRDGTNGRVLYRHRGDVPLAPASSQKLLVAAAALDRLGPDYRFTTTVVAAAPPVAGRVDGLWLVGAGDPLLASPEYAAFLQNSAASDGYPTTSMAALADGLVARGVRVVSGGVHGDASRYKTSPYLSTWPAKLNVGEFDIGPLGALEVDQGKDRWAPTVATADPTAHGAGVLARLLGQRGIAAAQAADGPAPPGAVVLAQVQSAPLAQIVSAMLRASDNQIAELLVREIDRRDGGPGTTAGGVTFVMQAASQLGLPARGLSLVDGSGLSSVDRVSCDTLLAALDLGDLPRFSVMATGLAVAGVSGTLINLYRGTPLVGRLAAKGGYIAGVTALVGRWSGLVPLRFSFVANGPFSFAVGLGLQQRVVAVLAGTS